MREGNYNKLTKEGGKPVREPFSGSKNSKTNLASPCYQRYLPTHLIFLLTTKKQMVLMNHLLGTERSAICALMYNMCQHRTELNSHPTSTQNDAKRIRTSGPRRGLSLSRGVH